MLKVEYVTDYVLRLWFEEELDVSIHELDFRPLLIEENPGVVFQSPRDKKRFRMVRADALDPRRNNSLRGQPRDYTQFIDSSKPRVGSHEMIGAHTQGRGEDHGVDGEQTVRGLQFHGVGIIREPMFLDANTHVEIGTAGSGAGIGVGCGA